MKACLEWLCDFLDKPVGVEDAARLLTQHGFPVEGIDEVGQRTVLDVEITSNRGDCLSHLGLARELAAATGQTARRTGPDPGDDPGAAAGPAPFDAQVHEPELCPLYTLTLIRGVKIGPSPAWLADRLEAVGVNPINNVVDVTNYVLMELGHPLHAFDLRQLRGESIHVRRARPDEPFEAIDHSKRRLDERTLVIADDANAVAIAGVMGGVGSEVTDATTDLLLEAAVFDPLVVRRAARRMKLASESSYRFERGVDPAGVDAAARRAAELIVDLAGGDIAPGVTRAGPLASAEPPRLMLTLRPQRCRDVLGLDLSEDQQARLLNRLGLRARLTDDGIVCEPPTYRLDLTREIDLVEEVARVHGLDALPVHDELPVRAKPGSDQQQATDAIGDVLVGHGFHEIITFSFVSDEHAQGFVPAPAEAVRLDDERRKAEPLLRPSLLPSLLAVRKQNQDAGNERVAIFELGAAWVRPDGSDVAESRCLSLLLDAAEPDAAVRHVRGTLEELLEQLGGPKAAASLSVHPRVDDDPAGLWWDVADLKLDDQPLGVMGLPSDKTLKRFGLQQQAVLAELDAAVLLSLWPPPKTSQPLPRHPAIERDLSIVVDENVAWAAVEQAVRAVNPALLEAIEYRGVYRGEQVGPGRKSLNFRLRFRDPDQTLRHEQVDSQMQAVVDTLQQQIAAELRT